MLNVQLKIIIIQIVHKLERIARIRAVCQIRRWVPRSSNGVIPFRCASGRGGVTSVCDTEAYAVGVCVFWTTGGLKGVEVCDSKGGRRVWKGCREMGDGEEGERDRGDHGDELMSSKRVMYIMLSCVGRLREC
jgi:hypothetical protein